MTIDFQCSSCGRKIRVQSEHAGKRVRCPGCKSVLTVPGESSLAPPPPPSSAPPAPHVPTPREPAPREPTPREPAPRPAQPVQRPGPPASDSSFAINPSADPSPLPGSRSVSSRYRKSSKNAVQAGIGSLVCALLGLAANAICCCGIIPFLPLMFEGVMAVIGIMLALNSRDGWKIAGLILNILVLIWTVMVFILILAGLTARDLQNLG